MPNLFTDTGRIPDATESGIPSYLLAADNHNIGNQGSSWFDPTTWGDRVENGFKFAAVATISGAAQLYNSGAAIGKLAGFDTDESKIQDVVTGIDSDLGKYYSQNRDSADLGGFLVSSFIPGIGGIKVLNAGQHALSAGKVGVNMSRATGLLVPQTEKYIAAAAHDINIASATFSAISQNGIKALASGVWQQTLEAAAFETAVQATMFKSPILENQTAGDIVSNIITGGIFGGVVGGAFAGAGIYKDITNRVRLFETENAAQKARALQQELNSPVANILRNAEDRDFAAQTIKPGPNATPEQIAEYTALKSGETQRTVRINNDIRSDINKLSKSDDVTVTNMVADALHTQDHTAYRDALFGADQIVRPGVSTKVEEEINTLAKTKKPVDPTLQVNYAKLTGEGAGTVIEGEPVVLSIADKVHLRRGTSLQQAVDDEVKSYKFRVGALWDAGKLTGVTGHTTAEARYIWSSKLEKLPDELAVHMHDIPMLEAALRLGKLDIKVVDDTGQALQNRFSSRMDLENYLFKVKHDVANDLIGVRSIKAPDGGEPLEISTEHIAKIVNTKVSRLEQSVLGNPQSDYFAWQSANRDYLQRMLDKGLPVADNVDARYLPTHSKITRRVPEGFEDGNFANAMVWLRTQETLFKKAVDNVVAKHTGDLYSGIQDITDRQLAQASKLSNGASRFSTANGNYGTLESTVQSLGAITQKLQQKFRQETSDYLQGVLTKLGTNQEAAIEFSTINQQVTRSGKLYVRYEDEAGNPVLVPREVKMKLEADAEKEGNLSLDDFADEVIDIKNPETLQAIEAAIQLSGKRTGAYKELRAAQGKTDEKDAEVFRPIRPNPNNYKSFAFVKDPKVTGQGHTTMLFAANDEKLAELGNRAEQLGYTVRYKVDGEEFHKAYGDYEYQRTLHESYIDSELKNKGIYSEFFTKTDPQKIVNDFLQQHLREDDVLAMELMRAKNQKAFDYLEDQGKAFSRVESSKFGGSVARVERSAQNPYLSYIKTALNISKAQESNLIYGFNKFLDEAVSKAVYSIKDTWDTIHKPYDAEKVNAILDKYGMNTGYRDAALDLLVNHEAPKGALTKFVRSANGILSTLTLGLDPLNALVNGIGANVLRGTELTHITAAIKAGNTELAGELGQLGKITLPTGDQMLSPAKLVNNAIRNFFDPTQKDALVKLYTERGYITGDLAKFHSMLDDFALKGSETISVLDSKIQAGFAKAKDLAQLGRRLTGNVYVEDFNRFISADVMRQITSLAEKHGLMSAEESHAYINTFVNRVEGNTTVSQRPLIFQGPIGNAVGLFQSYQFNMMQQLFRYAAEGTKKDMAMMLGLQGTFFGMNGLPGFQFINQHVIGTASGNKNHVDAYDAVYGMAGKQLGDLFVYGLPSDILRTNLYSRGDINPRQVTILPTSPAEVPIAGAFGKFLGSIKDTFTKVQNGGQVWESFLQGVEHNGISRPLAGMAQTLQAAGPGGKAYSTTSKDSILFSNDFLSLATLSRLAGGRPIDEAIVNDGVFRVHAYQQYDRTKMNNLAQAVKSASIQGNVPSENSLGIFAAKYAEAGGKQSNFNRWILQEMKAANTNEAEKITSQLKNPFAQKVQVLMGGQLDPYSSPVSP